MHVVGDNAVISLSSTKRVRARVCDSALSLHFPVQYENNDRFYEEHLALNNPKKNQPIFEAMPLVAGHSL